VPTRLKSNRSIVRTNFSFKKRTHEKAQMSLLEDDIVFTFCYALQEGDLFSFI
jgi:hypothetical protein